MPKYKVLVDITIQVQKSVFLFVDVDDIHKDEVAFDTLYQDKMTEAVRESSFFRLPPGYSVGDIEIYDEWEEVTDG